MPQTFAAEHMANSATAAGLSRHDRFQQHEYNPILWPQNGGTCYGLSMVWLAFRKVGVNFIREVNFNQPNEVVAHYVNMCQQWQRRGGSVQHESIQMAICGDPGLNLTARQYLSLDGTAHSTYQALANHLHAKKDRYHFIHINGHAMAAYTDSDKRVRFFDPNGGEVRSESASRLAKFFKRYFGLNRALNWYVCDNQDMRKYTQTWDSRRNNPVFGKSMSPNVHTFKR